MVILPSATSSSSPSCPGRPRTRSRTRPSAGGRRAVPARARGRCCSRRSSACSTSAMPGPVSRATTRTPRRGCSSSSTTTSPAAGEPHDVAGDLGDGGRDQRSGRSGRSRAARPAPGRACARRDDVGVGAGWGSATSSSRCWPRSSSGSLSRAHSSHSSRCRAASTSRCRRRSPPDSASSTGRQRSVGGSASLQGQQVLHPQPRPGPVQLRGDRTGGRAQLGGQRAGVLPGRPRGRAGSPAPARTAASSACGDRGLLLRPRAVRRPGASAGAGRRRGAGCAGAGPAPATSRRPRCAP